MDFLTVEDYAYSSTRAFSADRWATTGEAGTFADPFLSPGSDYISYANTYITDLVTHELEGEDIANRADMYDFMYFRAFGGFLAGVAGQYSVFGNPEVMIPKLAVNQIPNFTLIGALFGHHKLTDLEFMGEVLPQFPRVGLLAMRVNQLFAAWGEMEGREWRDLNPQLSEFPARRLLLNLAGEHDDETLKRKIEEGAQLYEAWRCSCSTRWWSASRAPRSTRTPKSSPGRSVPTQTLGMARGSSTTRMGSAWSRPGSAFPGGKRSGSRRTSTHSELVHP